MTATATPYWPEQADDPDIRIDDRIDPQLEDEYWQSMYWAEPYHRAELDYEDYAPAYCVGYIGYAQYGGSFEDAEKSLFSNWVRIKGASRLSPEDAMLAVRAAWDHAERVQQEEEAEAAAVEPARAPVRAPSREPRFLPQPAFATA
jgi:hypothetical protein